MRLLVLPLLFTGRHTRATTSVIGTTTAVA